MSAQRRAAAVYPRVGGGNNDYASTKPGVNGLSPRGRGKRLSNVTPGTANGSIPAWAGETS